MKIMAVGEIIFDVFGNNAEIGGAPLNFCAHCALLGSQSALVSAVGNDNLGEKAMKYLSDFGVENSFVQKNSSPTGMCIVTLENGIPSYEIKKDAAYFNTSVNAETVEKIKEFNPDIFSFGTLIQTDLRLRKEIVNALDECGFKEVFCDVNLRPGCYDEESCKNCFERATILKISAEEEPLLNDYDFYSAGASEKETVLNICKAFPNINLVLFTKGENGSLVYSRKEDTFYDIPCVETEVVSSVGAGDSYSAAFLCEYFKSGNCEKAGIAGAMLSSFVVAHREAVPEHTNS